MQIDKKLYEEIDAFCKENQIKTREFIHKILREGYMREKYGESPFQNKRTRQMEEEACEKIKDLVENQISLPPDIAEMVDEHFFEMLDSEDEASEKEKPIVEQVYTDVLNDNNIPNIPEKEVVSQPQNIDGVHRPRKKTQIKLRKHKYAEKNRNWAKIQS